MSKCRIQCEVYSRICGYHRPVNNWNRGKKEEFKGRKNFHPNSKRENNQERRMTA